MKVGRKLTEYALVYKKIIIAALLMLSVSVAAELAGPFIAKKLIDDHILGIESTWYETVEGKEAVPYEGTWYKRDQYFNEWRNKREKTSVSFRWAEHFISFPATVSFDGERSVSSGEMTITKGGESETYPAKKLTGDELLRVL